MTVGLREPPMASGMMIGEKKAPIYQELEIGRMRERKISKKRKKNNF